MSSEELPIGRSLGAERTRNEMRLVVGEVYAARLRYRCLVPREVEVDLAPAPVESLSGDRLTPLAAYSSNDLSVPVVHVQAIRLTREIAAVNWLRFFATQTNRRFLHTQDISPAFADALLTFSVGNERVLGRMAVTIWGDELYLLSTYTREDAYEFWSEKMGAVVSSFRLDGPPARQTIEPRRTLSIASSFELQAPASWRVSPSSGTAPEEVPLVLSNLDDEDVVNGIAHVCVTKGHGEFSSTAELALARFRAMGFAPQGIEHQGRTPVRVRGLKAADHLIVVGALSRGGPHQECRICIARGSNHSVALSLLTPVRDSHFLAWAINLRAYQILSESLRAIHR